MSPRLDALLEGLDVTLTGDPATPVSEVVYDSREAGPGALFAALRGTQTDGHQFVADAVKRGAAALLVEERPPGLDADLPVAVAADTRCALAEVAASLFDHPSSNMTLVGVTGTNGKSSTVRLLESVLIAAGRRAGSIGTISVRRPGVEEPATLTTPESVDLQRILAEMRDARVDSVVMEVSSHSLAQGRIRPLRFAAAVYTHLTQDHLDYHGDMESYLEAKATLFGADYLHGPAVLNARDPWAPRIAAIARASGNPVCTFGRGATAEAQVRTTREEVDLAGSRVSVACAGETLDLSIPLPGDFQIENALAAIATAFALDVERDAIVDGIQRCAAIPGRLERVGNGRPIVLVDYAHTPDAVDRVLRSVRPLVRGRLITVFGCGGDRDRGKRPAMAAAACRHSDCVLATSDNPRTEDPNAILRDVAAGLTGDCEVVVNRREAIERAVALALPEDVVVIAGKGHEDYQIVGTERRPFDDRREAARALAAREAAS